MRIASIMAVAIMAVFCLPVSANIINVPGDYSTIQGAINASSNSDTVLVQPGTYVENINFNGHNIVLGSLFLTMGDTSYISQTVIDGDSSGSVVTFESGEDSIAVIAGFTIQNGYRATEGGAGIRCYHSSNPTVCFNMITDNCSNYSGGGIACGYNSNPIIRNNNISGNTAANYGGGITCFSSSNPLIEDNLIDGNIVFARTDIGTGGGIFCSGYSSPRIKNNIISNNLIESGQNGGWGGGIECHNHCDARITGNIISGNKSLSVLGVGLGGGIYSYISNPTIENNTIIGNEADSGGAGIVCNASGPTIAYNLIIDNISHGWCGGVGCVNACTPEFTNNTFHGNIANRGAGLVSAFGASPVLINNIFWADSALIEADEIYLVGSTPVITYCNIQGGWAGEGNIDADPLFVDSDNGDFHLRWDSFPEEDSTKSPCIDAGCPDSPSEPDSTRCDIGAFYFDQTLVGIRDIPLLPKSIQLSQNHPNPFNASTVIKYELPHQSQVMIDIYDILGRRVAILYDGLQLAGHHQVIWDASDFSSGVYFYKLQAGDFNETQKMILLK